MASATKSNFIMSERPIQTLSPTTSYAFSLGLIYFFSNNHRVQFCLNDWIQFFFLFSFRKNDRRKTVALWVIIMVSWFIRSCSTRILFHERSWNSGDLGGKQSSYDATRSERTNLSCQRPKRSDTCFHSEEAFETYNFYIEDVNFIFFSFVFFFIFLSRITFYYGWE